MSDYKTDIDNAFDDDKEQTFSYTDKMKALMVQQGVENTGAYSKTDKAFRVENVVDGEPVSKDNPSHSTPTDHSGRVGLMSVFGDQITAKRIAQVSGQFKYGVPSTGAKSNIVSTGSINVVDSLLVVSTGTASDGAASVANRRAIRYVPGYDTFCNWTSIFTGTFDSETGVTTGIADSFQRAGLYDDNDGFFIGFEGETFGFTRRRLGVDYFTPIDLAAYKDVEGYGLDLTKGNIFRLNYGYLGFATVIVDVLEPAGNWANLFKLEYPNLSDETHITQTFLEPRFEVANTGNTTDIISKTGSFNAGIIDGGGNTPSTRSFADASQFSLAGGNADVIAYRVKSTYNGFENKVPSLFTWLSAAVEGNKPFSIYLTINPSELTAGTWTDRSPDSTMEFSTNTTWDTDGELLLPFSLAKDGEIDVIIKDLGIELLPTDVIVIRVVTSSTGYDISLGLKWDEQF